MIRSTTTVSVLAILAACSSPNPPTISAADVGRSLDEARDLSTRPFTDTADLPTGLVTYTGEIGADVSGDLNGSIQGDMIMHVQFTDNTVDGSVRDINLIDPDGRPNQRLGGQLAIDGVENSGRIDAFASGDLTVVDDAGMTRDTNVLLTMGGDVVDNYGAGDAVFGSVQGDGVGDLNFDVDGVFFGTVD